MSVASLHEKCPPKIGGHFFERQTAPETLPRCLITPKRAASAQKAPQRISRSVPPLLCVCLRDELFVFRQILFAEQML